MADERIKAYYDALWEMYLANRSKSQNSERSEYDRILFAGVSQGVDDALETFKSMFDLDEYAEGSEG